MRFRKRPIIVEAEQFLEISCVPKGVNLFSEFDPFNEILTPRNKAYVGYINTSKGRELVRLGDWIITTPDGEQHVHSPNTFWDEYEEEYRTNLPEYKKPIRNPCGLTTNDHNYKWSPYMSKFPELWPSEEDAEKCFYCHCVRSNLKEMKEKGYDKDIK